jgi:type IV pilus assembly protein PilA
MKFNKHRGFTLIELMVVVGIIGILASIAMPQYQSYVVRAQVAEALSLARDIQGDITAYYKQHGRFPKNNRSAGLPEAKYLIGLYVQNIQVTDGAINILFGNRVNQQIKDKVLSLQPLVVSGSPSSPISWNCGSAKPPQGMETVGENKTDIDPQYLPFTCIGENG